MQVFFFFNTTAGNNSSLVSKHEHICPFPIIFYKNVLIFLGVVILKKNVLSFFMKTYVSVSTPKYTSINVFQFQTLFTYAYYLISTTKYVYTLKKPSKY